MQPKLHRLGCFPNTITMNNVARNTYPHSIVTKNRAILPCFTLPLHSSVASFPQYAVAFLAVSVLSRVYGECMPAQTVLVLPLDGDARRTQPFSVKFPITQFGNDKSVILHMQRSFVSTCAALDDYYSHYSPNSSSSCWPTFGGFLGHFLSSADVIPRWYICLHFRQMTIGEPFTTAFRQS